MTPSQEAKDFAAANGFVIHPNARRYDVRHVADGFVVNVGGYPAALNAMKEYVTKLAHCDVVREDGAMGVDAEQIVGIIPDECVASGESCSYGPYGIDGENQCKYCAKEQTLESVIDAQHSAIMGTIGRGYVTLLDKPVDIECKVDINWSTQPAPTGTEWRTKSVDEIKEDIRAGIQMRNKRLYGNPLGMVSVDIPFPPLMPRSDLEASLLHDYCRKDLECAQQFRELRKHSSPPMTHKVVMRFHNDSALPPVEYAPEYPSYPDAVKGVRQVLSGLAKRFHPTYVSIERIGA